MTGRAAAAYAPSLVVADFIATYLAGGDAPKTLVRRGAYHRRSSPATLALPARPTSI